jgi:hypothetical protein
MKAIAPLLLATACLLGACTYDSVRMNERHRCELMPETLAKDCLGRTQDSRKEFEAKRRALEESVKKEQKKPADERYERWTP